MDFKKKAEEFSMFFVNNFGSGRVFLSDLIEQALKEVYDQAYEAGVRDSADIVHTRCAWPKGTILHPIDYGVAEKSMEIEKEILSLLRSKDEKEGQ